MASGGTTAQAGTPKRYVTIMVGGSASKTSRSGSLSLSIVAQLMLENFVLDHLREGIVRLRGAEPTA